MYILDASMYILGVNMYILGAFGYKSVPFERVQPQWQLLYLFSERVGFSKKKKRNL